MPPFNRVLEKTLARPAPAVLVPVAAALAFSWGFAGSFLSAVALLPILAISFAWTREPVSAFAPVPDCDPLTKLPPRPYVIEAIDKALEKPGQKHFSSACMVFDLDDFHRFNETWGRDAADNLLCISADRIGAGLRTEDLVARLDADAFAVHLAPSERLTFDAILAVAERILRALSEPIVVNGVTAYTSASAGFAMPRNLTQPTGAKMLAAAERAMVEARSEGRGTLQLYSSEMSLAAKVDHALADEVSAALDNGQITAWMQPQVSVDGSEVLGMEALARWHHPDRGAISPAEFLPAIEAAGRNERLSEVMLAHALRSLRSWDQAGYAVPCIGVNFGAAELRSPRLVDKIKWELNRFDIPPDRLCVEVLESVMAQTDNDLVVRNIRALGEMGCRIDLDDFGTGNAAITSIRRFRVSRIKIDRSFVRHVDSDGEQQRMIQAILTLAKQLRVEVLAEGVETPAEQNTLKTLGCAAVQGFGIARPMHQEAIPAWLMDHRRAHPTARRDSATPLHIVHQSGR